MKFRVVAAVVALALSGCAGYIANYAQGQCAKRGYVPAGAGYAECVEAETAAQYQGIAAAGQQMERNAAAQQEQNQRNYETTSRAFNTPAPQPAQQVPILPFGIFQRSYIQGTSKFCVYDKMGSPNIITIGAYEVCPTG